MCSTSQALGYDFCPYVMRSCSPLPMIRGILGLDFLERFDAVFDFAAQEMVLHPRGSCKGSAVVENMAPIPYRVLPKGMLALDIALDLNGERITVLGILDTGGTQCAINWKSAAALGLTPDSPLLQGGWGALLDSQGANQELPNVKLEVAVGGGLDPVGCTVAVVDMPVFQAMDVADRPAMFLGAALLQKWASMVMSAQDQQIWLPKESVA